METDLQKSYRAEMLWDNDILQSVLEEMLAENYAEFISAPSDAEHLMRVKMKRQCIDDFSRKLEARTHDAQRDRHEQEARGGAA